MTSKKKAAPKRGASRYQAPARKPVPGWIWLVCGLVIGGFLVMLANLEPGRDEVRRAPTEARRSTPQPTPAQPAQQNKPKYEFYTLLPESEVVVPPTAQPQPPTAQPVVSAEEAARIDRERAEAALAGKTPPPPPVVATAPSQSQLFLQAGAFRQNADADRVRAQILLLGQNARVESGKVRDELWHRVLVGPFANREQLAAAQKDLAAAGFGNLLPQQR